MSALKIIGIGEIVWDCLPSGKKLGGAPLNFAYFAKQLGAESYIISAVGDDELGKETLKVASETEVDLSYVQINSLPTSRVLISLDSDGIPNYEIVENVAWDSIKCDARDLKLFSDASAVCFGALAQRSKISRESIWKMLEATPKSCLKVFDINIRQHYYDREVVEKSLNYADVLKLNEDELPLIMKLLEVPGVDMDEKIKKLQEKYDLNYVILTCGASFSEVYGSKGVKLSHVKTPKVQVADTVGAGDSFTATFVISLLQGKSIVDAHNLAVKVSAFVCTQHGAINKLPKDLYL